MPELPEVEVLRRSLVGRLVGRRIDGITVRAPRLREPLDRQRLRALASGRRIVGLRRRAKYLLIDLEDDSTLVVHLGMSGRLTVVALEAPRERHEHVAFRLDTASRLRFVDPRRFGLVFALPSHDLAGDRHFAHLGMEPLDPQLTGRWLARSAHGRRGPVKGLLMDAKVVVGVGNIYACEALWRARIHPRRRVDRLSSRSWDRLVEAVRTVLSEAIAEGGTTLRDFGDGGGNAGYFQVSLAAYGRQDKPCRRCGRRLRRLVQAGRGTIYCPGCQR